MNANGAPTLYAQIPGAGSMGGGRGPLYAEWNLLEDLFTYAIENFGVDFGDTITREQASELRAQVVRKYYPDGRQRRHGKRDALKGTPSTYHVERIQAMFTKWYLYYPWVDSVAVARAVEFDPAVWPELTARERVEVVERLAKHPDPWEDSGAEHDPEGDTPKAEGTNRVSTTRRAYNWFNQPAKVRAPLFGAVQHRKGVLGGTALQA